MESLEEPGTIHSLRAVFQNLVPRPPAQESPGHLLKYKFLDSTVDPLKQNLWGMGPGILWEPKRKEIKMHVYVEVRR